MKISRTAEKEIRELSHSPSLRRDFDALASERHNPFFRAGNVDADAYILFVSEFNEFIGHEPKPFAPMQDKDMRL